VGALVVFGVMSNVVMLNFAYDVPVKIYSVHLMLMAAYLMAPDLPRLVALVAAPRAPLSGRWAERGRLLAKGAFILLAFGAISWEAYDRLKNFGDLSPRHPLEGVYDVEAFVRNGVAVPPLISDSAQWRVIAISRYRTLSLRRMNDEVQRYRVEEDEGK